MIKDANLRVDGLKIVGQLYLPEGQDRHIRLSFSVMEFLRHGGPHGRRISFAGQDHLEAGLAAYTFRFREAVRAMEF